MNKWTKKNKSNKLSREFWDQKSSYLYAFFQMVTVILKPVEKSTGLEIGQSTS